MTDEERADAINMLSLAAPTIRLSGEELYRFDNAIRAAVMALQERKTGKWTFCGYVSERDWQLGFKSFKCSVCDKKGDWKSPYCPHCGAKMEVDE